MSFENPVSINYLKKLVERVIENATLVEKKGKIYLKEGDETRSS